MKDILNTIKNKSNWKKKSLKAHLKVILKNSTNHQEEMKSSKNILMSFKRKNQYQFN